MSGFGSRFSALHRLDRPVRSKAGSCEPGPGMPSLAPMPSGALRILSLIMTAVFAVNSAVPGLPHGCEQASSAVAPAGHEHGNGSAHHHGRSQDSPGKSPCHCVDHSCCAARVYLAPAPFALPAITVFQIETTTVFHWSAPRFPVPYLLPPALAPPPLS